MMNKEVLLVVICVVFYLCVFIVCQVEYDVLIFDQCWQGEVWCEVCGYQFVEIFVELGNIVINDWWFEFQCMIEVGMFKFVLFDVVLVYSFLCFFCDVFDMEYYYWKFVKNGVWFIFIMQELGDDLIYDMMWWIMVLFDEYQLKENVKYVMCVLKENV